MLPLLGILVLFILNKSKKVGLDEQEEKIKEEQLKTLKYSKKYLLTKLANSKTLNFSLPSKDYLDDGKLN
jgi:hypothetical protein